VDYDIQFVGKIKSALFGGEGLFFATIAGPGRIGSSRALSRLAGRIFAAAPQIGRGGKEEGSILGRFGNILMGILLDKKGSGRELRELCKWAHQRFLNAPPFAYSRNFAPDSLPLNPDCFQMSLVYKQPMLSRVEANENELVNVPFMVLASVLLLPVRSKNNYGGTERPAYRPATALSFRIRTTQG